MIPAAAAGQLRTLITVQTNTPGSDSFGAPVNVWEDVLVARAHVATIAQRDQFQGGYAGHVTHWVLIRWPGILTVIKPGMRIKNGLNFYRIVTVDNVEQRNRWLYLLAEQINEGE